MGYKLNCFNSGKDGKIHRDIRSRGNIMWKVRPFGNIYEHYRKLLKENLPHVWHTISFQAPEYVISRGTWQNRQLQVQLFIGINRLFKYINMLSTQSHYRLKNLQTYPIQRKPVGKPCLALEHHQSLVLRHENNGATGFCFSVKQIAQYLAAVLDLTIMVYLQSSLKDNYEHVKRNSILLPLARKKEGKVEQLLFRN